MTAKRFIVSCIVSRYNAKSDLTVGEISREALELPSPTAINFVLARMDRHRSLGHSVIVRPNWNDVDGGLHEYRSLDGGAFRYVRWPRPSSLLWMIAASSASGAS